MTENLKKIYKILGTKQSLHLVAKSRSVVRSVPPSLSLSMYHVASAAHTNLCLPWLVALTMSTYLFVWFTDCCHRIVLPFQRAGTFDANFSGQAAAVLRHEKAPCLPIFSWSTAQGLLQLKKSLIICI